MLISADIFGREEATVLCGKCGKSVPDNAQFCPKCGDPTGQVVDVQALLVTQSKCKYCGTSLPEGSDFCPKCGQQVSPSAKAAAPVAPVKTPSPALSQKQRRRLMIWLTLLVLLGVSAWAFVSDDPVAQELRDDVTGAETQTIVETPFSVKAQSFSYFKFTVPPGAVNVTVTGQFSAAGDAAKNPDNNIEAYILTDSAFVLWGKGYATSTHYESGRVVEGGLSIELPAGSGIYYFVFNNKFSQRAAKTVHATALLHYKTWIPEWLLRMKDRFWTSLGP